MLARVRVSVRQSLPQSTVRSFSSMGLPPTIEDTPEEKVLLEKLRNEEKATSRGGRNEFSSTSYRDRHSKTVMPERLMNDKSWPFMYGSEMFWDLINIPLDDLSEEDTAKVLTEAVKQMNVPAFKDIQLPEMDVQMPPEDHECYQALAVMKTSLENNAHIKMSDKNEIMQGIIDEVLEQSKDKTSAFYGLSPDV